MKTSASISTGILTSLGVISAAILTGLAFYLPRKSIEVLSYIPAMLVGFVVSLVVTFRYRKRLFEPEQFTPIFRHKDLQRSV